MFCNLGVSFLFLKIDVYNLPNGQDSKLNTINIKLHEGYASNYKNMPIDNLNKLSFNRLIKVKSAELSLDYTCNERVLLNLL